MERQFTRSRVEVVTFAMRLTRAKHFARCLARYTAIHLAGLRASTAREMSPVVLSDISRSSRDCLTGLRSSAHFGRESCLRRRFTRSGWRRDIGNAVSASEAFRKMSCQIYRDPSCGTARKHCARNFAGRLAGRFAVIAWPSRGTPPVHRRDLREP
jgi:hypothetical protein